MSDAQNVIIFLFGSIAIGALMRLALKNTSFPYTVAMILVGLTIGSLTHRYSAHSEHALSVSREFSSSLDTPRT